MKSIKLRNIWELLTVMGKSQSKASDHQGGDRSVFVVSWGRNGHSSWSFHESILITDSVTNQITRDTDGTHYDWGSIVENVTITKKPPVQIKRFSPTMFDKGIQFRNSYELRGTTNWSDERIQELFNGIGGSYSVIYNNCRDVAEGVARALKIKAESKSISRVVEDEFDFRLERMRGASALPTGILPFPRGAELRGRREERLEASGASN